MMTKRKREEKETKSKIAVYLVKMLGHSKISIAAMKRLIDAEYEHYILIKTYERKVAENEVKLKMLYDKLARKESKND